jgi:excisionase family DNA binding protein
MESRHTTQDWMTVEEMRRKLYIGKSKAYELLDSEDIDAIRIGRTVRVSRDSLERWIKLHPYKREK